MEVMLSSVEERLLSGGVGVSPWDEVGCIASHLRPCRMTNTIVVVRWELLWCTVNRPGNLLTGMQTAEGGDSGKDNDVSCECTSGLASLV